MGASGGRPWRPEKVHTVLAFAVALTLTLGVWALARPHGVTLAKVVGAWLVGVNVTAFGYYAFDKGRARSGGRRVPEVVLHGLAVGGGSVGAYLGMRCFRHKTIKGSFRLLFWVIVVFQVFLISWVGWFIWTH